MFREKYIINKNMMYMADFYDRTMKPCTLVREVDKKFIVPMSPLEIFQFTIREIGLNYKSATEASKPAHPDKKRIPFVINPLPNIVLFSTKSFNRKETIWFNSDQIHQTYSSKFMKTKTCILFNNGEVLTFDSRLSDYDERLKTKEQYRSIESKESKNIEIKVPKNSFSFIIDPKNKNLLFFLAAFKFLTELLDVIY